MTKDSLMKAIVESCIPDIAVQDGVKPPKKLRNEVLKALKFHHLPKDVWQKFYEQAMAEKDSHPKKSSI